MFLFCVILCTILGGPNLTVMNILKSHLQPPPDYGSYIPGQPPADHPILILTSAFQPAIQENDLINLDSYINLYAHNLETNPYFGQYDCSNLHTSCQTAINIIKSYLGGSHIPGQYQSLFGCQSPFTPKRPGPPANPRPSNQVKFPNQSSSSYKPCSSDQTKSSCQTRFSYQFKSSNQTWSSNQSRTSNRT